MPINISNIKKLSYGRIFQILAVLSAGLSCISDGMHYAWSSPSIPILQSPSTPVPIDNASIVWLENSYTLGGCIGLPLTLGSLDIIGRKSLIILLSCGSILSWLLIAVTTSVNVLYIARFISGITTAINSVATTVYVAEISDKHIRGRLSSLLSVNIMFGTILLFTIGPQLSIATTSTIGIAILVTHLVTFMLFPESPYYLLMRNRLSDAQKSLQTFRSPTDVLEELEEISKNVKKQNAERGNPLDILIVKSNRKVFVLLTVLSFGQQFSGVTLILMNLHLILKNTPITILSTNTVATLFVVFLGIASVISTFLIDYLGRKLLLSISSFFSGLPMLTLGTYYWAVSKELDVSQLDWIPILSILIYAITVQCGLAVIPMVLLSEMYPTNIKALGVTICALEFMGACAIAIYLYYLLIEMFGFAIPFFLFGICCMLTSVYSFLCIPETKGRSLEEVQRMLKGEDWSVDGRYDAVGK